MAKKNVLLVLFLFSWIPARAMEKLPPQYLVAYGDPQAPVQVTEYISLSCSKCQEIFNKEFQGIQDQYIRTGQVYWVFHLNPYDFLTLQALVCLERLREGEKRMLLETVMENMQSPVEGCALMQIAMNLFGEPQPQLSDVSYLATTSAYKVALAYLKQPTAVKEFPTVEINGKLFDSFPTRAFIERQISLLTANQKEL